MSVKSCDPLHQIAEQVADCLAASGYAFVEDDKRCALDGGSACSGDPLYDAASCLYRSKWRSPSAEYTLSA